MLKTKTRVLSAHIPAALAKKVDIVAHRQRRSTDEIVEQALAAWIAEEQERDRLTYEALSDVAANRIFDSETVKGWANQLSSVNINQTLSHNP